jgi:fatty acid desaturase
MVYWSDFLFSAALAGTTTLVLRRVPLPAAAWITLFSVSVLAAYRLALFVHELAHLRRGRLKGFSFTWNLLCGIPFLIPSFLYGTHSWHHGRKHYGTANDGEYLPLATGPTRDILLYLCQPLLVPPLVVLRFLILVPAAWMSPALRRWVHAHVSSLVIDPTFVRPLPRRAEMHIWYLQEASCFCYLVALLSLIVVGRVPWTLLVHVYGVAVCVLFVNAIRTLGAHRYELRGEQSTFVEQFLDSWNYPFWPLLTELWAPVGLRFHALHHLFPSLPYHSLGTAHKRLVAGLPGNSPYHRTTSPGLWASLRRLWRKSRLSVAE